jgi:hypothetical protein
VVDFVVESLTRLSRYYFWCLEFGGDYAPEDEARKEIDELLGKAGWAVQDHRV